MASSSCLGPCSKEEQCLWCKKGDATDTYSARTLLCCSACQVAYCHIGCDAVRRGSAQLSEEELETSDWFCSTSCAEVHTSLVEATNALRSPLPAGESFELVQARPEGPRGREAGSREYTLSAVASCRKIFGSAFAPLILGCGRDMLELVCNSYATPAAEATDAPEVHDYSGFRLAILRHGNTVVCCATLRLFGRAFAELPFVATRETHLRKGCCTRLLAALQDRLHAWGVRFLILPSVPQTQRVFTSAFGFSKMGPAERKCCESRIICPDADSTTLLIKEIKAAAKPKAPKPPQPAPASSSSRPSKPIAAPPPPPPKASTSSALALAPQPPPTPSLTGLPIGFVPGAGSFLSLFGQIGAAAAAAPASSSTQPNERAALQRAGEAIGHSIADVLISILHDADDERRAAQAEQHALSLSLQKVQAQAAELRAQLDSARRELEAAAAAAAAAAPALGGGGGGEWPAAEPAASMMDCDSGDGGEKALQLLRQLACDDADSCSFGGAPDESASTAAAVEAEAAATATAAKAAAEAVAAAEEAEEEAAMGGISAGAMAAVIEAAARPAAGEEEVDPFRAVKDILRRLPPGVGTWMAS